MEVYLVYGEYGAVQGAFSTAALAIKWVRSNRREFLLSYRGELTVDRLTRLGVIDKFILEVG